MTEPLSVEALDDGDVLETMNDASDLDISVRDGIYVTPDYGLPGEILASDMAACRSVIHVIDTVLIPERDILHALDLPGPIISSYEARSMPHDMLSSEFLCQGAVHAGC